jgi:hypothetical protein
MRATKLPFTNGMNLPGAHPESADDPELRTGRIGPMGSIATVWPLVRELNGTRPARLELRNAGAGEWDIHV